MNICETCPEHNATVNAIAEMNDKLGSIDAKATEIYVALRGDLNKRGWLTRIEQTEEWQEEHDKHRSAVVKVGYGLISSAVVFVAALLWALLTHTIQFVSK